MKHLSRLQFSGLFFGGLFALAVLSNCGGVSSFYYDGRICIEGISQASTGAEIYAAACSSCHGNLSVSTKRGASLALLNSGIAHVPSMRNLSCMTEDQKKAVVAALAILEPNMGL